MVHPMGESKNGLLRVDFDRRVKCQKISRATICVKRLARKQTKVVNNARQR